MSDVTSIYLSTQKYLFSRAAYSIQLSYNKMMSNDHRILFTYQMLSTDGEMGEDRGKGVLSSRKSNSKSLKYNNLPRIKISNPRQNELKRFSSILAQQSYFLYKYFLKQKGAHRHFIFPKLGLIKEKKNHQPLIKRRTERGNR